MALLIGAGNFILHDSLCQSFLPRGGSLDGHCKLGVFLSSCFEYFIRVLQIMILASCNSGFVDELLG